MMWVQYRLVGLGDAELLARLSELVKRGNELTAELLAHLAETDARQLHVELGFPSLFAYCTEALGFSESAAGRRIAAARVCRSFPEVFELVAQGELHLSALSALRPYLNRENARDLFQALSRKSRRQVDEILAAHFPRPALSENIRRLRVPAGSVRALLVDAVKTSAITRLPGASEPAGPGHESLPSEPAPRSTLGHAKANTTSVQTPKRARPIEPVSSDHFAVRFTIDREARELLERAQALASHRLPNLDLAGLFTLALDALVQRLEKERFSVGTRARSRAANSAATSEREASLSPGGSSKADDSRRAASRPVPAYVKREVSARPRAVHVHFARRQAVRGKRIPRTRSRHSLGKARRSHRRESAVALPRSQPMACAAAVLSSIYRGRDRPT